MWTDWQKDRWTDRQTDRRWPIFELDQDFTQTNILTKFESSLQKSIPVITARCSNEKGMLKTPKKLPVTLTFDIMTSKTVGVLLIWYITQIKIWKFSVEKYLSYHSTKKVDGQTDRRCDYYRAPAFFNVGALMILSQPWAFLISVSSYDAFIITYTEFTALPSQNHSQAILNTLGFITKACSSCISLLRATITYSIIIWT